MPSTYVPRPDAALRDWACAFAAHLSADPARFGRSAAEVLAAQTLVDAFAARLAAASDRPTRTAGAIAAKESARAAMLAALRPLAQRIRRDPRVTDADCRALGLAPAASPRSRIPRPLTAPQLHAAVTAPGRHTIRFADSATPARRRKPPGTVGLQLFAALTPTPPGDAPPPTPDRATYRALVTRQLHPIDHPADRAGQTAHYFARWQNTRGESGPWSAVMSMGIGG